MDTQNNIAQMLALMDRPAFCVLDGVITAVNPAAAERMICVGQKIAPMIEGDTEIDTAFSGGEISLTLRTGAGRFETSVHTVGQYHIFKLAHSVESPELRTLALAAQKLRNPLSDVISTAQQMFPKMDIPEDSPAIDQMARINRGLNVLHRIICNMSDAARYAESAPRMELQDADAVLREFCEEAQILCQFKGIRLEYSGPNTAAYTMLDRDRLERCFYNILSNSMKAMPRGGLIQIKLARRVNTLYLTVQDSGSGMAAGSAFDRHLRETSIEDSRSGLGLGMQLIRACAQAHGGAVMVESQEGQGTRLTMSMAVRIEDTGVHTPTIDYAGESSHGLMELSESLPHTLYKPEKRY